MDLLEVMHRLRGAFARDTSESPSIWTPQRPSTGHCAIVSVILQSMFGGQLVRAKSAGGVVHYWNVIDGVTVDATRDQFDPGETFVELVHEPSPLLYLHAEMVHKMVLLLLRAGLTL